MSKVLKVCNNRQMSCWATIFIMLSCVCAGISANAWVSILKALSGWLDWVFVFFCLVIVYCLLLS